MSVYDDLFEIGRSLDHIEKTGMYDVEKYSCSLKTPDQPAGIFLLPSGPKWDRTILQYVLSSALST